MNNIVTFVILVIILLASFQTVDSIQAFMSKHKDNPKGLLQFGATRLIIIFLAMASFAYMLGMSSWIINSMLILMVIIVAFFALLASTKVQR